MNELVSPLTLSLTHMVISTADTFGVFAHVYVHEHDGREYLWKQGTQRQTITSTGWRMIIWVRTPEGGIGQAATDLSTPDAVIACFHQARQHTRISPLLAAGFERLQQLESRYPPLLTPDPDKLIWEKTPLLTQIEAHHRHVLSTYSLPALTTTLTLRRETCYITRSDGTTHRTSFFRGHVRDQIMLPTVGITHSFEHGATAPTLPELTGDLWISSLDEQIVHWHQTRQRADTCLPMPPHPRLNWDKLDLQLLMDIEITAHLLATWFLHQSDSVPHTVAHLQADAVEGALSYQPMHPYGYLLVPSAIVTRSGLDLAGLLALREAAAGHSFSCHLHLELPELALSELALSDHVNRSDLSAPVDPTTHPDHPHPFSCAEQASRHLDQRGLLYEEDFYLLEGVDRFHADPATGRFGLRPRRLYRYEQKRLVPVTPVWLTGSIESLMPSFVGGMSPTSDSPADQKSQVKPLSSVHPHLTYWTMSAPLYSYLHFAGIEQNERGI
ncbi:hypothetical protein [Brevibacillus dissolubilis]|uniref:hypothetical protein n=1 Tax=Brevibacillus dissolubilis TaxID=1844116 RepID=UPI0011165EF1|nr:hypothetical protein [Brevibacillus dissolubilis]